MVLCLEEVAHAFRRQQVNREKLGHVPTMSLVQLPK